MELFRRQRDRPGIARATIALCVFGLHGALVVCFSRSTPVAETEVWISLPVSWPMSPQARPAAGVTERRAKRLEHGANASTNVRRSAETSAPSPAPSPSSAPTGAAPVDWYAQLKGAASVANPRLRSSPGVAKGGSSDGIFQKKATRKGRLETNLEGELVFWANGWCYTVVSAANLLHRGMFKCVVPLGGSRKSRGDLFDHMNGNLDLELP